MAEQLMYSIKSLSEAVDLSDETIRLAIKAGELVPVYRGRKPLVPADEAKRWLDSFPSERAT